MNRQNECHWGLTEIFRSNKVSVRSIDHSPQMEENMNPLLTEVQISEQLQVSLACLRRWRLRGEGHNTLRLGLSFGTEPKTSNAGLPGNLYQRDC
jgi:hypothetical protein